MRDEKGESRGFGFVCYEQPENAQKAIDQMHTKMIGQKPLYVAHAQRKDDRKALLAAQFMQRIVRQQSAVSNAGVLYIPTTNQGFSAMPTQRMAPFMGMNPMPMQQYGQQRSRGSRYTNSQQSRVANYSNAAGYNVHAGGNYNMQSAGYHQGGGGGYSVHPGGQAQVNRAPSAY